GRAPRSPHAPGSGGEAGLPVAARRPGRAQGDAAAQPGVGSAVCRPRADRGAGDGAPRRDADRARRGAGLLARRRAAGERAPRRAGTGSAGARGCGSADSRAVRAGAGGARAAAHHPPGAGRGAAAAGGPPLAAGGHLPVAAGAGDAPQDPRRTGRRQHVGRRQPGAGSHEPRDRSVRRDAARALRAGAGVNARVLIILGFAIGIGAIVYLNQRNKGGPAQTGEKKSGSGVALTVLYSTEKKEWLEGATPAFAREHSDVDVQLVGKGALGARQAILDGQEKPGLWSPADSLVLGLGAADGTTKTGSLLIAAEGSSDAPAPLVITPLVFVVWEDRAEPLLKAADGKLTWKALHDAIASNRGWPAVGGKPDWGFVKLGHTDPTRSNSGLEALLSMTLEYWKKSSGLTVGDLLDPKYQAFVAEIEKGVGKFETSTGTFMDDMIRFGPSRFDIAWVYENLAASQLENAQGRWGNLKVYYPQTTVWSDHPIALLQTDWVTDAQKKAARQYIAFLRS